MWPYNEPTANIRVLEQGEEKFQLEPFINHLLSELSVNIHIITKLYEQTIWSI